MLDSLLNPDKRKVQAQKQALFAKRQLAILKLLQYQRFEHSGIYVNDHAQMAFSVHSKCGEDGLILGIFERVGVERHTFVEIGIQDGLECNSANLAIHFGWSGVMLEGGEDYAREAAKNYDSVPRVTIKQSFVTRENINALFDETKADRDCDLFSIDIDGNDYWIWEALEDFRPRLVVAEYNPYFGPERAVTIPYDPQFAHRTKYPRGYFGASLAALNKLATKKGYALVAGSDLGRNAFFLRRELLSAEVPEIPLESVYLSRQKERHGVRVVDSIQGLPLVEV
ncbi:MAG: hypothetical protein AMXMBFR7_14020 [Planctomycetota bacterium]